MIRPVQWLNVQVDGDNMQMMVGRWLTIDTEKMEVGRKMWGWGGGAELISSQSKIMSYTVMLPSTIEGRRGRRRGQSAFTKIECPVTLLADSFP